jgi:glycosyltransferase involved in cell wall biosynthesis
MVWAEFANLKFSEVKIVLVSLRKLSVSNFRHVISANVIHGHHIKSTVMFILFNLVLKRKLVFTSHGSFSYLSRTNRFLLKIVYCFSDEVFFVNKYLFDILPINYKKVLKNKYKIILNGVELDICYTKKDMYTKYELQSTDKIIFHPARFVREKNHKILLQAFKRLLEDGDKYRLILAGDGYLKEDIRSQIKELSLDGYVSIIGVVDRNDVYNLMEIAELFVMPSISEGLNVAFLEALSLNQKILVSNIDQFTYPFDKYNLLATNYNVYFTSPTNPEEMYRKMKSALLETRKLGLDIDDFSLGTMMEHYIKSYEKIIL